MGFIQASTVKSTTNIGLSQTLLTITTTAKESMCGMQGVHSKKHPPHLSIWYPRQETLCRFKRDVTHYFCYLPVKSTAKLLCCFKTSSDISVNKADMVQWCVCVVLTRGSWLRQLLTNFPKVPCEAISCKSLVMVELACRLVAVHQTARPGKARCFHSGGVLKMKSPHTG